MVKKLCIMCDCNKVLLVFARISVQELHDGVCDEAEHIKECV